MTYSSIWKLSDYPASDNVDKPTGTTMNVDCTASSRAVAEMLRSPAYNCKIFWSNTLQLSTFATFTWQFRRCWSVVGASVGLAMKTKWNESNVPGTSRTTDRSLASLLRLR